MRALRRLHACLAGLILLLPIALGPATMPLVRALGGLEEHHCACGMKAGKCGCPECARIEEVRKLDDEHVRGQPLLKSSCDDGSALTAPALAHATLGAPLAVARAAIDDGPPSLEPQRLTSRERPRPPLPPPRDLRV
jgi:hypothetical protein